MAIICVQILLLCILFSKAGAMSYSVKSLIQRSKFLAAGAASFTAAVTGLNPESCAASPTLNDNPRYIDSQLEMKYADDSSKILWLNDCTFQPLS